MFKLLLDANSVPSGKNAISDNVAVALSIGWSTMITHSPLSLETVSPMSISPFFRTILLFAAARPATKVEPSFSTRAKSKVGIFAASLSAVCLAILSMLASFSGSDITSSCFTLLTLVSVVSPLVIVSLLLSFSCCVSEGETLVIVFLGRFAHSLIHEMSIGEYWQAISVFKTPVTIAIVAATPAKISLYIFYPFKFN